MHGACTQTVHPTTPRSTHAPRSPQSQPNSRWICSAIGSSDAGSRPPRRQSALDVPKDHTISSRCSTADQPNTGRAPHPVEPAYRRAAFPRARPATAVHRRWRGLCALPRVGGGIARRRPGHGVCRSSSRGSCGPGAVRRRGRKRCASAGCHWRRSTGRYRGRRSCRVGGCRVGGRGRHSVARPRR